MGHTHVLLHVAGSDKISVSLAFRKQFLAAENRIRFSPNCLFVELFVSSRNRPHRGQAQYVVAWSQQLL